MECRQGVFAGVVGALILAGCADGDAQPVSDSTAFTAGMAEQEAYPTDSNADDELGMIVTGLGELASTQIVSPWLVTIRTFRRVSEAVTLHSGDAAIELTRYAEDFPVSAHIRFFSEALDTCLIRNDESGPGGDPTNPPPPGISGGDSVIINTSSGPWHSFNQQRLANAERVYLAKDLLPGALPAGSSLSIPGDAFPSVGAYPLFEPDPVVRLLPDASQPLTTESRYSWIPLGQPGHVKIDFMAYGETGDFQGFAASCWVVDDGSFDLPGEVLEALELIELQAAQGLRLAVRYSRIYSRLDLIDGIVFQQTMEVAE